LGAGNYDCAWHYCAGSAERTPVYLSGTQQHLQTNLLYFASDLRTNSLALVLYSGTSAWHVCAQHGHLRLDVRGRSDLPAEQEAPAGHSLVALASAHSANGL